MTIRNSRQYFVTRSRREKFVAALEKLRAEMSAGSDDDFIDVKIQSLVSQIEDFDDELKEYERLQAANIEQLKLNMIKELPSLLIKARIARGWTQKELASAVGYKEQQIQRYEAEMYNGISFQRLISVAEALGIDIRPVALIDKSKPA